MGTAIRKDPEAKDGQGGTWKLEDAKARFSEVVRLLPTDGSKPAFVPFLEGLGLDGLDLEREMDRGRDILL